VRVAPLSIVYFSRSFTRPLSPIAMFVLGASMPIERVPSLHLTCSPNSAREISLPSPEMRRTIGRRGPTPRCAVVP